MGLFDGNSQTAVAGPKMAQLGQISNNTNGVGMVDPNYGLGNSQMANAQTATAGGGSGMMAPQLMQAQANMQNLGSAQTANSGRAYVPLNFNASVNPITQAVNTQLPSSGLPAPGQAEREAKLQQALANSRKGIGQTLDQGPGAFPQGAMGMPQRPPMAGMGGKFDPQQLRQQFQSHLANGGQLPTIPPGMDPEQLRRGMQALGMDPSHVDRAATMGAGRGPMLAQALMNRGRGY